MYLGSWAIDNLVTFSVNTHAASTGAATDADSPPTYRVYEDETGTAILSGTMAKLDDANTLGFYSEQITLSAANGFEKGKSYNIYISTAVGGVTGTTNRTLQIEAEVDANVVSDKSGFGLANDAITAAVIATNAIDADAIADNAIDAGAIASNAITSAKIADNAITAAKIATDAIDADALADGAITSGVFAAGAIDAGAIATDAIGSAEISAAAVTKIQTGLSTHAAADVWAVGTRAITDKDGFSLSALGIQAIFDRLTSNLVTTGSFGKLIVDNLTNLAAKIGSGITGTGNETIEKGLRSLVDPDIPAVPTYLGAQYNPATDGLPPISDLMDGLELEAETTNVSLTGIDTDTNLLLTRITGAVMLASAYVAPSNASIASILAIANKLDTALELDGSVYRYTVNALEQAASGSGPTLQQILDGITADHGAGPYGPGDGSGANTVNVTVRNSVTVAGIPGALVTVYANNGTTLIDQKRTGLTGIAIFSLDDGDYKVSVNPLPGYSSLALQVLTVNSNPEDATYNLVPITPSIPPTSDLRTIAIYRYKIDATPESDIVVSAQLAANDLATIDNALLSLAVLNDVTDADGYAELQLITYEAMTSGRKRYKIKIGTQEFSVQAPPAGDGPLNLEDLLLLDSD
jgi:hypothetical protein